MSKEKINENPLELAEKIIHNPKSSKDIGLLRCVQCGMCTSVCPAARHSEYNPRNMIERVLEGDETVLEDENLWNCFYCYTCHSICPVGNSACEVNQVLKQIAFDEGKTNKKLKPFYNYGEVFINQAMGGIPKNFVKDLAKDFGPEWVDFKKNLIPIREKLGLGKLNPPKKTVKEINLLLMNSGFDKRLKKIKKGDD
ncbi:MAG: 4Fe-4S dicluster domain-containing protein [Methanobacteriaceae archaeon]|jgi:heterodisulfide reductase subunit C|uniref:ferredoxin:CoB-CoM heterodisulfide reductase subunit HdrC n=1 Tax=Methanobrevibacter TaxID=2172 RepID=UPI002A101F85|nr:4Fe-4S dicluster domain-containing protein [Methanobacteriaceae archaeon]MDD3409106.1 4Fe-4S dicluster domain-containing protein [Methanobacteriaceae archaeon]MDD4594817.1 4Fe-4S dicluster domain-containing protein [Methanobacteriaceae archaeon]